MSINVEHYEGGGREVAQGHGVWGAERRADEKANSIHDTGADEVSTEDSDVLTHSQTSCWALREQPALLTLLTHQILTIHMDLVLADKLVSAGCARARQNPSSRRSSPGMQIVEAGKE